MILKISLRPLNNFFFGGESSFNEPGVDKSRRTSYVLHSRRFPQQTGALGLIRNQLLLQSGLLSDNTAKIRDKEQAKILIGPHGFRLGAKEENYGVIRKLSPVFLEAIDGKLCVPAPLDDVQIPGEENDKPPRNMVFEMKDIGENETKALLRHYREKAGVYTQFQHPDKGNALLGQLYSSHKQVGITKAARPWGNSVEKKGDESGYYYQTFLRFTPEPKPFKNEHSEGEPPFYIAGFCFYVELSKEATGKEIRYEWSEEPARNAKDNRFSLQDALVEFGGERSTFHMRVNKIDDADWPIFKTAYQNTYIAEELKNKVLRLVCLSPCYVQGLDELRLLTHLRVSETVPFRFLRSSVESTENYQEVKRKEGAQPDQAIRNQVPLGLLESKLFQLFDRGSVFYFDAEKKGQIEQLFKHKDFQTIGYNQYHIL